MDNKSVLALVLAISLIVPLFLAIPSVEGEVADKHIFLEPGGSYSYIFNEFTNQPETDIKIIIGDVRVGEGGQHYNNTTEEFSSIDVYIMTEQQLNSYSCGENASSFDATKSKENLTEDDLTLTLEYYNPSNESEYYFVIDFCDNGRPTDSVPGNVSWIRVEYGIYDSWDVLGEDLEDLGEGILAGVGIMILCCAGSFLLIIILLVVLILKRK